MVVQKKIILLIHRKYYDSNYERNVYLFLYLFLKTTWFYGQYFVDVCNFSFEYVIIQVVQICKANQNTKIPPPLKCWSLKPPSTDSLAIKPQPPSPPRHPKYTRNHYSPILQNQIWSKVKISPKRFIILIVQVGESKIPQNPPLPNYVYTSAKSGHFGK